MERKAVPLNLKATTSRKISGHGSVFGNVDKGGDVVLRGAFLESLEDHKADGTWPVMLWMHYPDQVAGKWDDIHEDEVGLAVAGTMAKTPLGNEIRELLKMDAVRGLSIGYYVKERAYTDTGERQLIKVELAETSIVSMAMNPLAQVESVKSRLSSAGEYVPTTRQFERMLRDVGMSQSVAKRVKSAVFDDARDVTDTEESDVIADILETCGRYVDDELVADIKRITTE